MILTNCNKVELINCGCVPFFSYYVAQTYSMLEVGELISNTCTFSEYVIDWYVNGVLKLTTGKGPEVLDGFQHPLAGTRKIYVQSGVYTPILRKVKILGETEFISAILTQCRVACLELATPLPIITVLPLGCETIGGGAAAWYNFRASYSVTEIYATRAAQAFNIELPGDLVGYLAVYFQGKYVVDRVQVFYYDLSASTETELCDYYVGLGGEHTSSDGSSDPPWIALNDVKMIADYSNIPFELGDYLIVKVTPSVFSPGNTNTEWLVDIKCLDKGAFDDQCNYFPLTLRDLNFSLPITMVWNPDLCNYTLSFNMSSVVSSEFYIKNIYKYAGIKSALHSDATYDTTTGQVTFKLWQKTTCSREPTSTHYSSGNINVANWFSYVKTGNIVVFTFGNDTLYQLFNAWYYGSRVRSPIGYSEDKTNKNHYLFMTINWKETMIGCGDTGPAKSLVFHRNSPVVFDGVARTMTITMQNTTNGYPASDPVLPPCFDNAYAIIQGMIAECQASIDQSNANINGSSICYEQRPVNSNYVRTVVLDDVHNSKSLYMQYYFPVKRLNNICADMPGWWEFPEGSPKWSYSFYIFYIRVDFTHLELPDLPENHEKNFKLMSWVNRSSGELLASPTRIYELEDNNVIFPI